MFFFGWFSTYSQLLSTVTPPPTNQKWLVGGPFSISNHVLTHLKPHDSTHLQPHPPLTVTSSTNDLFWLIGGLLPPTMTPPPTCQNVVFPTLIYPLPPPMSHHDLLWYKQRPTKANKSPWQLMQANKGLQKDRGRRWDQKLEMWMSWASSMFIFYSLFCNTDYIHT